MAIKVWQCTDTIAKTEIENYFFVFDLLTEINHHAIQETLKSSLKEKCQNLYQGFADEGDTVYFNKVYTKLHVIEGTWGGFSVEYDIRQQRSNAMRTEETSICDIFKPHPEKRV